MFDRKKPTREKNKHILVICEGTKTEPNYFKKFRVPTLKVVGLGMTPPRILNEALKRRNKAKASGINYKEVWCVFDKDDNNNNNFKNVIEKAKSKSINIAYSNECFEIWYLLHFNYHDTAMSRKDYGTKLTNNLNFKYYKNNENMYDILLSKQLNAIKNAKTLFRNHNNCTDNPSTTVHLLVDMLNRHIKN